VKHGPHKHSCHSSGGPRWVGDPVDVVTGENVYNEADFTVPGSVRFAFRRNYNHTWAGDACGLGRGFRHSFYQWLVHDVDGLTYINDEAREVRFPFLDHDGQRSTSGGYTLERTRADEYRVSRHAQPTRVFRPGNASPRSWPLAAVERDGEVLRLAYERGVLKSVWVDPLRALTFVYDGAGQITEVQLRQVDKPPISFMRYRYDEHQRLVQGVDPYKQTFQNNYDALHRLVQRTDTAGYSFFFEYDTANRCTLTYGEDGLLSVQLRYNPAARETTLIDANGAEWRYEYDAHENLVSVADPYGGVTIFERGPGGELAAEIDPAGRKTSYIHDAAGAQVAKRLPNGTVVPLPEGRDPAPVDEHRVPSIAIEWEYGDLWDIGFGLPDSFELGEIPAAVRAVLTTSESPQRGRVEEVHDQTGLLTREVLEDGRKRRYGYTHRGKVRRYRDFDGSDYKLETRSWDLPWRLTDPLGNTTELEFTNSAELQEAVDPSGNRIHYEYDLKDRLVAIGRNQFIHDRYEYDGSDNLVAKYDGNGRLLLEREYDAHNRLIRRTLASGDVHEFEYDRRGWMVRARTYSHDTRFAWDASHRKVCDERDGIGVRHRFVSGSLVETTVLGRFRTEYHGLAEKMLVVVDPTGATHRIRRHGRGVFTRDFANGWSETAQYSPRGWCLAKVAHATDAPEHAWVRKYEYSGEGDLQRVLDTDKGLTQHHHDAAHRLVGTLHPDGRQDTYRYTKSGSLLEKPGLRDGTVGHLNQLRYAEGHQFEYGVRQHVTTHTTPDGQILHYQYDARDQLVAVLWNGQEYFKAEYDAIGRRVEKTVAGQTTRYYWDGDRLAAEVLPDGRVRVYVYPDAFSMVPMLFVDYESEDADPASGTRYYLFCDQRGCPERVVDDLGVTVWEAYVEPYGTAHVRVGRDFYQPLRFPGHWWDAELGLHYNRFRYYSPWLGRYLQVDPIGEGGGWNVYAYTPRPLQRVDVRGLDDCGDTNPPQNNGEDHDDAQRPGRTQPTPEEIDAAWRERPARTDGDRQAQERGYPPAPDGHHWRAHPNGPVDVCNEATPPTQRRHFDRSTGRWEDGPDPNAGGRRQHGDSGALRRQLREAGDPNADTPHHQAHHVIPASVDNSHPLTSEARRRGTRGHERGPDDYRAQTDDVTAIDDLYPDA
jgi:RHS repeat-associated protein